MLSETHASLPNASCRPSDAGRLTLRYIAALSAVALLSLAGRGSYLLQSPDVRFAGGQYRRPAANA